MATLNTMTDEVRRKLAGYTLRQDRQTYLTSSITSSSTSIPIASAEGISSGIAEIEDELVFINSFDRNGKTLDVQYGRGFDNTTKKSYSAGTRIRFAPTFPSIDIKNAINETIQSVFPDLYAFKTYTFTYQPMKTTYALPNDAINVYSVSFQVIGPSKEWLPIRNYRVDNMANIDAFDSPNTISLYSGVQAGRTVQVTYATDPSILLNGTDDFESVTGLPTSCKDVITLGAAARLISFVDPGRLTFGSAEADHQSQVASRSYGSGTNAAKYLLALYQQRLQEEARKLFDRNPIRIHFTR